jgi:O-antigen/teichoic acid export membrane protein
MRSKQALYNLISNIIFQIATAAVGIILPRLIIETYGSEINGMVSSIRQFISYLQIVEAGVGVASITALYGPLAQKDTYSINSILSATRNFYRKSGVIFIILIAALSIIYPIIVRDQVNIFTASLMVFILGGTTIVEYFLIGKYRVLLIADQKNYVMFIIQTIATIFNFLVVMLLISLNCSIIVVQLSSTLIFFCRYFCILFYIKRYYPNLSFDTKPNNEAINQKWDVLIHQIAALVTINTPVVLLTIFGTLKEVSIYSIYYFVFAAVAMIISSFSSGFMSGFGQLIATGDKDKLKKAFSLYEFIFYPVLFWAYSCAAVLIMPFISFYTINMTDAHYYRPVLAILFIVAGLINNIRTPSMTMVSAAGHFKNTTSRAIIEAIISFISTLIFVNIYGVEGILIGAIVTSSYRTIDFIYYSAKYILEKSITSTIQKIGRNAIISIGFVVIFSKIIPAKTATIIEWLLYAIITGCTGAVVFILVNYLFDRKAAYDIYLRMKTIIFSRRA